MDSASSFTQPLRANRDYGGNQIEKNVIEDYDEYKGPAKEHKCACPEDSPCRVDASKCNCFG